VAYILFNSCLQYVKITIFLFFYFEFFGTLCCAEYTDSSYKENISP
jgi:hypothetical protein